MNDDTPAWMQPGSLGLSAWQCHMPARRPGEAPTWTASREHLSDIGSGHAGFTAALWARAARPADDGSALPQAPRPVVIARRPSAPARASAAAPAAAGREAAVDGPEPGRAPSAPADTVAASRSASPGASTSAPAFTFASARPVPSPSTSAMPRAWPSTLSTAANGQPLPQPATEPATVAHGSADVGADPGVGVMAPAGGLAPGASRRAGQGPLPAGVPPAVALAPGVAPRAAHVANAAPASARTMAVRRADPRVPGRVAHAAVTALRQARADAAPPPEAHAFGVRLPNDAVAPGAAADAARTNGSGGTHELHGSTRAPTPSAGAPSTFHSPLRAALETPQAPPTAAPLPNTADAPSRRESVLARSQPADPRPRRGELDVPQRIAAQAQAGEPAAPLRRPVLATSTDVARSAAQPRIPGAAEQGSPAPMPASTLRPSNPQPASVLADPAPAARSPVLAREQSPTGSRAAADAPSPIAAARSRADEPVPASSASAGLSPFAAMPATPGPGAQPAAATDASLARKADAAAATASRREPTFQHDAQAGAAVVAPVATSRPRSTAGLAGGTRARLAGGAAADARAAASTSTSASASSPAPTAIATPTPAMAAATTTTAIATPAAPGALPARRAVSITGEPSGDRARASLRMAAGSATSTLRGAPSPAAALDAATGPAGAVPASNVAHVTQGRIPASSRGIERATSDRVAPDPIRAAAPTWPLAPLLAGAGGEPADPARHAPAFMSLRTPAAASAGMAVAGPAVMTPFMIGGAARGGSRVAPDTGVATGSASLAVSRAAAPMPADPLAGAAPPERSEPRPASPQHSEGAAPPLPDIETLVERACARLLEGLSIEQQRRGVPSWR
jgi:hypothetical protein